MYLSCISNVFLPLYSVHSDVLYRCVSCMYRRCIVMYRSCAWCPRSCYCKPVLIHAAVSTFFNTWTIRCRIQVSYMYQMYRESLGGISAVSQLALMSLVCAVSRPPGPTYPIPTLLAYYPYYCILPLPPLLATTPTTLQNGSDTPRNGYTYLSCIVMYFRTFPTSRNISCHPYVIHVHCT